MKKMITMLAGCCFVTVSAGSAVACQNVNDIEHKWDDNNSGKNNLANFLVSSVPDVSGQAPLLQETLKKLVVDYFYPDVDANKNKLSEYQDLEFSSLTVDGNDVLKQGIKLDSNKNYDVTFTIQAWYHATYFFGQTPLTEINIDYK